MEKYMPYLYLKDTAKSVQAIFFWNRKAESELEECAMDLTVRATPQ